MTLRFEGRYHDRGWIAPGAAGPWSRPRCNRVVDRALDLVAGLLARQPGLRGLLYWAVGEGDAAWDGAPPPDPPASARTLVNEIYRRRLDPGRDLRYDPETRRLVVRATFGAEEAVGAWREFGLFGGDASSRPGSGFLVSCARHPRRDKVAGETVERELSLSLTAGSLPSAGLDLIFELLARREGLVGIQYMAFGSGDPAWDAAPPAPAPQARKLTAEVLRRPIVPAQQVRWEPEKRTLSVGAEIGFDEASTPLREVGLFGGDASPEAGTGYLLARQVHPVIDREHPFTLAREIRLALGAGVEVAVPNLSGLDLQAATTALEASRLVLGPVGERETEAGDGRVLRQHPEAGATVEERSEVAVVLAVPLRITVPSLLGLTSGEATLALSQADLTLAGEPTLGESEKPPGSVIAHTPRAGERVPARTPVALVLAAPVLATVPDLAGLTVGQARVTLSAAHLRLHAGPPAHAESPLPTDSVVSQEPTAGARATEGSAVAVTLASPQSITVPDLRGTSLERATQVLAEAAAPILADSGLPAAPAGLAVGEVTREEADATVGTVLRQAPAAGERLPVYGTVTVVLAAPSARLVPNLFGLEVEQARLVLAALGLALGRETRREAVEPAGTVVEQEPPAGTSVPIGRAIPVIVADPVQVAVPDLAGLSLEAATEALRGRRLALGDVTRRVADGGAQGVLSQQPGAGEQVPRGTGVALVIRGGVPDVVGLSRTEADAVLSAAGLALGSVGEIVSRLPVGQVVGQDPPAGAVAAPGAAVTVVLAARVPAVTALLFEAAAVELRRLGLVVGQRIDRGSDREPETVMEQQPAAGEPADPGDAVDLTVAIPRTVEVPDLVGQFLPEARRLVEQAGLLLDETERREDPGSPGRVLSQRPLAGAQAGRGTTVRVVVSISARVDVPAIVGLSVPEANVALSALGLVLAVSGEIESDERSGTILSQDPPAGTVVETGSRIAAVVSLARTVLVPSVLGLPVVRAESVLGQVRLQMGIRAKRPSDQEPQTVLDQSPTAGERAAMGSVVLVDIAIREQGSRLPVVSTLWPPPAAMLRSDPPLGDRVIRRYHELWRREPHLELSFSREMQREHLVSPLRWLRLWRLDRSDTITKISRVELEVLGFPDEPILGERRLTVSYRLVVRDLTAVATGLFFLQIDATRGKIFDASADPQSLDADFAGTRLPPDVLDRIWSIEDAGSLPSGLLRGLEVSQATLPSGNGEPGGRFHTWFAILG